MAQQSSQAPAFVHPYGPEAEQLPVVITEDETKEENTEEETKDNAGEET